MNPLAKGLMATLLLSAVLATESTILLVQVSEHGATVPQATDSNYQISGATYDSGSAGSLTDAGIDSMVESGQSVRDKYITDQKFLPGQYDQSAYLLRTDGTEATTMSALAYMNGLYPNALTGVKFLPAGAEEYTEEDVTNVLNSEKIKDKSAPVTGTTDLTAYGKFPLMSIGQVSTDCSGIKHRVENHLVQVED